VIKSIGNFFQWNHISCPSSIRNPLTQGPPNPFLLFWLHTRRLSTCATRHEHFTALPTILTFHSAHILVFILPAVAEFLLFHSSACSPSPYSLPYAFSDYTHGFGSETCTLLLQDCCPCYHFLFAEFALVLCGSADYIRVAVAMSPGKLTVLAGMQSTLGR